MKTKAVAAMMAVMLTGSIIFAGCNSAQKPPAVAQADPKAKPALAVPATFANEQAKIDFATKAIDDHHYTEGKALLEAALAKAPDSRGFMKLGTANYNLKDYSGAIEAWKKAADLEPGIASAMQTYIGNALRDSKKYPEAEAAYRNALKADPKQWLAALNLASLLNTQGKKADAITVLEQAVAVNKDIQPIVSLLNSYKQEAATQNKG